MVAQDSIKQTIQPAGMINKTQRVLAQSGQWITDRDLRIISTSGDRWEHGLAPEVASNLVGKLILEVGMPTPPNKAAKELKKAHLQALKGHTTIFQCTANGKVREFHIRPRLSDDGQIVGVSGTGYDVTEIKRYERQLNRYERALRKLASQISLAEERERRRIAEGLHDRVSQNLALCCQQLSELQESECSQDVASRLDRTLDILSTTIDDLRSLTFEISSPLLYEFGLEAAIENLAENIQSQFGVEISVCDDGQDKPLDSDVTVLVFKTLQELIRNVVKHSKAHHAKISFRRVKNTMLVVIDDDGRGFQVPKTYQDEKMRTGLGLFTVKERIRQMNGHMVIHSAPGEGTCITISVPLAKRKS